MTYSQVCEECNRQIVLEFDQDDGTPAFCPFCGSELSDGGDFAIKPEEDAIFIDEFDDNFENF